MIKALCVFGLCCTVTVIGFSEEDTWSLFDDADFEKEVIETTSSNHDYFMAKAIRLSHQIRNDPELRELMDHHFLGNDSVLGWDPMLPEFSCDTSGVYPPAQNVHELRPSDVKVVAAMGDSITAGNGVRAVTIRNVFWECRGESWSIGGDNSLEEGVITLPNALKKFNPDLMGYSICISMEYNKRKAWLNLAQPGADNKDMEDQAWYIVARTRNDERIDYDNDWKVVTLFIGGNDFCKWCDFDFPGGVDPDQTPEQYRIGIQRALDVLHRELPRTFVNLVPMFDITPLSNFSSDPVCALSHLGFCECVYINRTEMKQLQMDYYQELVTMVDSGRYDTNDSFTVVIQPMFVETDLPIDPVSGRYYRDFMSPDCFHPGHKAHQTFAWSLWNTMLIPVEEKPLDVKLLEDRWYCPTEANPYFATKMNGPLSHEKKESTT